MISHRTFPPSLLVTLVLALPLVSVTTAHAQEAPAPDDGATAPAAMPDPFAGLEPAPSTTPLPRGSVPMAPSTAAAQIAAGQWTFGGTLLGSYTATTNEVSGQQVPASTFFLRATPTLGYFVADRLELRVGAGLLLRQLFRSQGDVALESDLAVDVGLMYMVPLTDRFNLHVGAGLGAYVGQSDRQTRIGGEDIVEKTNTWGGLGSATVGGGYVVTDHVMLSADVIATGLVGLEHIATEPDPLFASSANIGVGLALQYAF